MENGNKSNVLNDDNEISVRVDIKEEHCCSQTIKSETKDSLRLDILMRENNFSSEPFIDNKSNDIKLSDLEKIEVKEEPNWLETTAAEEKSQAELSPVSLKIDKKENVPFMNGTEEDTSFTESRIDIEPALSKISTVASKTKGCLEISNEDLDCGTSSTYEVNEIAEETGEAGSTDIELPYKCQICEKHYRIPSLLKKHGKIAHNDNRKFKCAICGRRFNWLSAMNSHMLIHEGIKPHKCLFCGKSFTRMSHLKMHILTHEGKKPHKCKICGKSFTDSSNLRKHNLIHEGKKPFKCEICEKSFTQLVNLKLHNLMHEGKKPHKCNTCQKQFTHVSHLKLHFLIHGGTKPHKCEICEKRFIYVSQLRKHSVVHEGKQTYKCDICEKHFTGAGYLKNHVLTHEGKKPQ